MGVKPHGENANRIKTLMEQEN